MSEQAPLFEVVTEPLGETEDVRTPTEVTINAFKHLQELGQTHTRFISWADLDEQYGIKPEQFNEDHDGAMSPVDDEPLHEQDIRSMIYTPEGPQ